jgi:D-3-phosphoglycerate dehydrogenase
MSEYTVVTVDPVFEDLELERDILDTVDAELTAAPADTPAEVIEAGTGADALIVVYAPVTEAVFEALPELQVIGKCGIGFDNIDVDAARAHGVDVANVPDYCIEEVSTHTLALVLSTLRRVPQYDKQVKSGGWDWEEYAPIRRLTGQVYGFIGFGNIAQRLAEKLQPFGLDLLAYDPYLSGELIEAHGAQKVSFDEILARSDIMSIHSPLTEETENLFDAEAFDAMGDDAILVNTSRGGIVDEQALSRALDRGNIDAAALDVFAEEPPADSELFDYENFLATPHAGWYSESARVDMREGVANAVATLLDGGTPDGLITN